MNHVTEFVPLPAAEVKRALRLVKTSFPAFSGWEYSNQEDDEHFGFCVWGELAMEVDKYETRRFYVTFESGRKGWSGDLTIGQHAYMWTSADFGDAILVSVEPRSSLKEAVTALKSEIAALFRSIVPEVASRP